MPFHNNDIGVGRNNPLVNSVFIETFQEGLIAPGSPQFIITEDGIKITTESGTPLITEG